MTHTALTVPQQALIDVDAITDTSLAKTCTGMLLEFPEGKNHYTSYPFGLHTRFALPWNFHSIDDRFYLQSNLCMGSNQLLGTATCQACTELVSNPILVKIIDRIRDGVHENTPLIFQPVGGLISLVRRKAGQVENLQLLRLNDARKLAGKVTAIEAHKELMMHIASGKVKRVAVLVQTGQKNKASVQTIVQMYEQAAAGLYSPKGYTADEVMQAIVMLRLGGSRVAEFAQLGLGLPAPQTAHTNSLMRPLQASPAMPTVDEIEGNIMACDEMLKGYHSGPESDRIIHQILMFDEIAVEKRPRWDDRTNMFLGLCREHCNTISPEFCTEQDLDILTESLNSGKVHLAPEVSIQYSISDCIYLI